MCGIKEFGGDDASEKAAPLWQWVRDKKVDAAFLPTPQPLFAAKEGLKVIDVPELMLLLLDMVLDVFCAKAGAAMKAAANSAATAGIKMTYTSGWPMSQKRLAWSQLVPPPDAT